MCAAFPSHPARAGRGYASARVERDYLFGNVATHARQAEKRLALSPLLANDDGRAAKPLP